MSLNFESSADHEFVAEGVIPTDAGDAIVPLADDPEIQDVPAEQIVKNPRLSNANVMDRNSIIVVLLTKTFQDVSAALGATGADMRNAIAAVQQQASY